MLWFTADLHLGHRNIIRFQNRPFADVDAMNAGLIEAINDRVARDDELYVLGDFSYRMAQQEAKRLRGRIVCERVHLVPGNHDYDWEKPALAGTFLVEPPICVLKEVAPAPVVVCHYPMMSWPAMRRRTLHLHGHIHADAPYNERQRAEGRLRYDVGVDANGYRPVSLEEARRFFAGVTPQFDEPRNPTT